MYAPEDVPRIRTVVRDAPTGAYILCQRTYLFNSAIVGWRPNDGSFAAAARYPGFIESRQVRLFPNDPRIRYSGAVHESVEPACARIGLPTPVADIAIHHFGRVKLGHRAGARDVAKGRRYLELGLRKISEGTADLHAAGELATQLFELGYVNDAREVLEWMVSRDPAHRDALNMLGKALTRLGAHDEAEGVLRRLVREHPTFSDGWNSLGVLRMERGDAAGAVEPLRRAVDADPGNVNALANLALVESRIGRHGDAERHLARARGFNATSARYRMLEVSLRINRGDVPGAIAAFETLSEEPLHLGPADVFQYCRLGVYLGRVDRVRAFVETHLDTLASDRSAAAQAAEMLEHNDCADLAERVYRRIVEFHPDVALAHNELGRLLAARGDLEGALERFGRATRLDPANPAYLRNMGLACERLGMARQALECYAALARLEPEARAFAVRRAEAIETRLVRNR